MDVSVFRLVGNRRGEIERLSLGLGMLFVCNLWVVRGWGFGGAFWVEGIRFERFREG